jgi:Protein of unknown function (DUF1186)
MTQDPTTGISKPMDTQHILQQFEVNEGTFPREAVAHAIAQREAIIPELLRILADAHQDITHLHEKNYLAHLYAMYLLAQFREPRAYPLIVQFFSTPGEIALDVTGDVVTEDLGRILASVAHGDIGLITALVENEQANEYVRDAALRSLVSIVACGDRTREDVLAYYQRLLQGRLPRAFSLLWNGLVWSSTHLYPEELYEDITHAYDDGLIENGVIRLEDVEETLHRGKARVLDELRTNQHYRLITDTITEMEGWACFQPTDRPARTALPALPFPTAAPLVRTTTKKSTQQQKDKHKRKLAKASRRRNRR